MIDQYIGHKTLVVDDYDKAISFYVGKELTYTFWLVLLSFFFVANSSSNYCYSPNLRIE